MAEAEQTSYESFEEPARAEPATPAERLGADARALGQAADHLRTAYRRLAPGLRDPEKRTLRYWRAQQRLQWIVGNYGHLLPEDVVTRYRGRAGRAYLANGFDESVPSHRAVLTLRALTREVLAAIEQTVDQVARRMDHW